MIIWFATGNKHKKDELASILNAAVKDYDRKNKNPTIELKIPSEAGLDFDPEETGISFLENAMIKARELHRLLEEQHKKTPDKFTWQSGDAVIAEDSGICVDALDGRPGILSARYGGKDLGAAEKNLLLLEELGDNPLRSARFVCAMVLYYGQGRFFTAQECMEGELVKRREAIRGKGGFGYDPILYIPELGRTVAELSAEEKNSLSHRSKAGRAIAKELQELFS